MLLKNDGALLPLALGGARRRARRRGRRRARARRSSLVGPQRARRATCSRGTRRSARARLAAAAPGARAGPRAPRSTTSSAKHPSAVDGGVAAAVAAARAADVAVVVVGCAATTTAPTPTRRATRRRDRDDRPRDDAPAAARALARAVAATPAVLSSSRPGPSTSRRGRRRVRRRAVGRLRRRARRRGDRRRARRRDHSDGRLPFTIYKAAFYGEGGGSPTYGDMSLRARAGAYRSTRAPRPTSSRLRRRPLVHALPSSRGPSRPRARSRPPTRARCASPSPTRARARATASCSRSCAPPRRPSGRRRRRAAAESLIEARVRDSRRARRRQSSSRSRPTGARSRTSAAAGSRSPASNAQIGPPGRGPRPRRPARLPESAARRKGTGSRPVLTKRAAVRVFFGGTGAQFERPTRPNRRRQIRGFGPNRPHDRLYAGSAAKSFGSTASRPAAARRCARAASPMGHSESALGHVDRARERCGADPRLPGPTPTRSRRSCGPPRLAHRDRADDLALPELGELALARHARGRAAAPAVASAVGGREPPFADVDGDPPVVGQPERPVLDDFVAVEDGPGDRAASEAERVPHLVRRARAANSRLHLLPRARGRDGPSCGVVVARGMGACIVGRRGIGAIRVGIVGRRALHETV